MLKRKPRRPVPEYSRHSRIVDVVDRLPHGRDALYKHGYRLGDGFVDVLSQYVTLEEAAREGRLRDLEGLIKELNSSVH